MILHRHNEHARTISGSKTAIAALVLGIGLFWLPLLSFARAGSSPSEVVDRLHLELLKVMEQADTLGYKGRYQHLEPVIQGCYDLSYIARFAVGRYWKSFSDSQKTAYLDSFRQLSIAIYANRFNGYGGEKFETLSEVPQRKERILVKSALIRSTGEKIELDYLLHHKENRWLIVNVIAQGVSDLSLKRADYTSILKKESIDALIDRINERIGSYAK
jgi:phospholipid transport system substrate-binding protein